MRIDALRARVIEAVEDLRAIEASASAGEPRAADALLAVTLLRRNLEEAWMPVVEAIHASQAMVAWRRTFGSLTGLVAGSASLTSVTSSLADRIDALTSWLGGLGLEHLTDGEVAGRLDDASAAFVQAALTGDDLLTAWAHVDLLAGEAHRRLDDDDGTFAGELWETLGDDGLARIVKVVDTAGEITDLDLMAGTADTRSANHRLQVSLGGVVGAVVASDAGALDHLVELAPHSSHLGAAVAASPEAFGGTAVVALASEMIAYTNGTEHWASRPRVADRHASTSSLLAAAAHSPAWSLELLAEPGRLEAVTTNGHYDDDSVEAVVAAALGAAADDHRFLGDGLQVLADLVALTAGSELNAGTRRGVALSIGTYLPAISIQLDPRLPIDVPLPAPTSGTDEPSPAVIRLGSYDDLARLLGQVVDDTPAQLTLGLTLGAFRADQISRATTTIEARPDFDTHAAGVQLAADLAAVSRVINAVTSAIAQRNDLLVFRHGMAQAEASTVVGLLDTTVTALPGVGPVAARISRTTTKGVFAAIGATTPSQVPDTGLDAELKMHFTVAAVGVPLHDVVLRRRFGVDRVPASTWDELGELAEQFAEADDLDERSTVHSRILRLVDDTPDLQIYMTEVGVLSGDTTLD